MTVPLVPPEDEPASSHNVVLPTRNRRDVVIRRTCIEITSFAANRYEAPYMNVDAGAEIKHTAGELPRSLVGSAVDPGQALFVVGISAADECVRRNSRRWAELHANPRREIE